MQHEVFRGPELRALMAGVQKSLGEHAMIVSTGVVKQGGKKVYEVVAARPEDVSAHRRSLVTGPIAMRLAQRERERPFVVALVGPPGAGKTTASMKIALHPQGLRGKNVGLVTLDTYRVGAVDEMHTYAEIVGMPLEVIYHPSDVEGALARLSHMDAIVVDTPGRSTAESSWVQALRALSPDEIHLVLPAGLRMDVAKSLREKISLVGPTHALFTKLDEVPGDADVSAMATTLDLPVRWVGDGYDVPGKLIPAGQRISAKPRAAAAAGV